MKALTLAKRVAGMLNVEYKHKLTSFNAAVDTSGNITQVTDIDQGDTSSTRGGNRIKVKSLYLFGNVRMNASATQTQYRILIIQDKHGTGTAPTVDDIIADASAMPYSASTALQDDMRRFNILYDKLYNISSSSNQLLNLKYYKRVDIPVIYRGTSGTDEGDNQFYVIQISNESTNTPIANWDFRVRYLDN